MILGVTVLVYLEEKRLSFLHLLLHKPEFHTQLSKIVFQFHLILNCRFKCLPSSRHIISIITSHPIKKTLIILKSTLNGWIIKSELIVPLDILELPTIDGHIEVEIYSLPGIAHLNVFIGIAFHSVLSLEEIAHVQVEIGQQARSLVFGDIACT